MLSFLRLIRLPNLAIIVLTMYSIRYCLMVPILGLSGFNLQTDELHFGLLVLATVLISAAGYIINDYFDARIDQINKPELKVIDKSINRRLAIILHAVFSGLGVLIGAYISWRAQLLMSGIALFGLAVIGLWVYSTTFKYQMVNGNLLVAALTAMIPFMPVFFEIPTLHRIYNTELLTQQSAFGFTTTTTLLIWAGGYAVFAFALSIIREVFKDMEDVEGDKAYGCKTLPIVLGTTNTKWINFLLIAMTMGGVIYSQDYLTSQLGGLYTRYYSAAVILLPLLFLLYYNFKATEKKQFFLASSIVKFIMLGGIGFLFLVRYLLTVS